MTDQQQTAVKLRKNKYILLCLDCGAVYSRNMYCKSWCGKTGNIARVKRLKVYKK